MNKVSRVITGGIIVAFSIFFLISFGFLNSQGIDYFTIASGFFFLVVGFLILFNKKEDEIEKIKKRK